MLEPIDRTARLIADLRPMCDDRDVREYQRDRCGRLVEHDLDALDSRIFHDVVGDLRGDGLDEIARRSPDDRLRPLRQLAVVQVSGQIVRRRGGRQVHPHA